MAISWPQIMTQWVALLQPAEGEGGVLPIQTILVFLAGLFLGAIGIIYYFKSIKKSAAAEAARMREDAKKDIEKDRAEAKLRLTEEIKNGQAELENEKKEFNNIHLFEYKSNFHDTKIEHLLPFVLSSGFHCLCKRIRKKIIFMENEHYEELKNSVNDTNKP